MLNPKGTLGLFTVKCAICINILHTFLGMQSPRNGLILVLEGGCIPLYLVKVPFWTVTRYILGFILTFLFKNAKLRIKKKKKKKKWVGWKSANKHLFFLGLRNMDCKNQRNQMLDRRTDHVLSDFF